MLPWPGEMLLLFHPTLGLGALESSEELLDLTSVASHSSHRLSEGGQQEQQHRLYTSSGAARDRASTTVLRPEIWSPSPRAKLSKSCCIQGARLVASARSSAAASRWHQSLQPGELVEAVTVCPGEWQGQAGKPKNQAKKVRRCSYCT